MHAPITALWTGLLGILMLVLAMRVVRTRISEKVVFGDGGNAIMLQHIRVHANFTEYVPMGLVLLLVLELNGTGATSLNVLGGSLFAARLLHAFGLSTSTGTTPGRFAGTVLTWLVLLAGCALTLWVYFKPPA
ncbi:MAG TPA: MAPEG family protein [Myxococcota bacterium]|nr:MAPEG family protein [Myxococcota bacterium]